MVQALQQQLPVMGAPGNIAFPKIVLFLTEQECDEFGITFDVNQIYEVELINQIIKFKKA
jgi:hypothetical protein